MEEATLRAYQPTWRDRLAGLLSGDMRASPERRAFVGGLLGSNGLGENGVGLVDATPIGGLLSLQSATQSGDRNGMALAAAGMLPGAGIAEKVAAKGGSIVERLAAKYPQIDFALSEAGSGPMTLSRVVVPEDLRGQGIGTQFMNDFLTHADEIGRPVALSPSSDFGGNKNKLTAWYKSLGFAPNKGRARDFSTRETMIRYPQEDGSLSR